MPDMGPGRYSIMSDILVVGNGILKLMGSLNPKASGRDGMLAHILKECSCELADILTVIFNQSLENKSNP